MLSAGVNGTQTAGLYDRLGSGGVPPDAMARLSCSSFVAQSGQKYGSHILAYERARWSKVQVKPSWCTRNSSRACCHEVVLPAAAGCNCATPLPGAALHGAPICNKLASLQPIECFDDVFLCLQCRTLGALAEKCHAFAKALHYKELEFATAPENAVEALISINNQLRQPEAAVGVLTVAQRSLAMDLKVQNAAG